MPIPGPLALDTALGLLPRLLKQSTPASIQWSWDRWACCAALARWSLSLLKGSSVQALKPFLDYIKGWARRTQADKQNFLSDCKPNRGSLMYSTALSIITWRFAPPGWYSGLSSFFAINFYPFWFPLYPTCAPSSMRNVSHARGLLLETLGPSRPGPCELWAHPQ